MVTGSMATVRGTGSLSDGTAIEFLVAVHDVPGPITISAIAFAVPCGGKDT